MNFHRNMDFDLDLLEFREVMSGLLVGVPLISYSAYFYNNHLIDFINKTSDLISALIVLSGAIGIFVTLYCLFFLSHYVYTAWDTFVTNGTERIKSASTFNFTKLYDNTFGNVYFYSSIFVFSFLLSVLMRFQLTLHEVGHYDTIYVKNYFLTYPKAFLYTVFGYFLVYVFVNVVLYGLAKILKRVEKRDKFHILFQVKKEIAEKHVKKTTVLTFLTTSILFASLSLFNVSILFSFVLSVGWFVCASLIMYLSLFYILFLQKMKTRHLLKNVKQS